MSFIKFRPLSAKKKVLLPPR